MGYKIGLPSLKLNNAGGKSKKCGSFHAVAREALEERSGQDPDIDKARSTENIYRGFRTAAELIAYSNHHIEQLRDRNGRAIRNDAVVMCVTILKPPAAFMNTLSKSDQLRFLDDAEEGLAKIVGKENIKASATHFDELGAHRHVFHEPMTPDGRLCAKEVHGLKFFGRVNRELPALLRERGWDIDDCEMYDVTKTDYENERAKNNVAGRSSMRFKADIEREKRDAIDKVNKILDIARDAQTAKNKALNARDIAIKEKDRAIQESTEASKKASDLLQAVASLQHQKTSLESTLAAIDDQISTADKELAIVTSAINAKKATGATQFGMAEWNTRIAAAKQQAEKDHRIQELEKRVNLFERFLAWAPASVKQLWEQFLSLVLRKNKEAQRETHRF